MRNKKNKNNKDDKDDNNYEEWREWLERLFNLDDSKYYWDRRAEFEKRLGSDPLTYNKIRYYQALEEYITKLEKRFDLDDSKYYEEWKKRLEKVFNDHDKGKGKDDDLRDP